MSVAGHHLRRIDFPPTTEWATLIDVEKRKSTYRFETRRYDVGGYVAQVVSFGR